MVNDPVIAALAVCASFIDPTMRLEVTADCATPDRRYFAVRKERRMMSSNAP
jgi:hypothetical protein